MVEEGREGGGGGIGESSESLPIDPQMIATTSKNEVFGVVLLVQCRSQYVHGSTIDNLSKAVVAILPLAKL